ncbi:short-chain dehydrogenase/reductase SDR [Penicillium pulvis]|uniref:short-chain dehydrogenase/reductase SDR n=1 Tax=Penicillium pulvis TaxID=1562058 RepID=UPI0025470811|nr:short-chain dehydrogenase/reductase SDR [Penicillium pulvis]KAJ5792051.1 short-chain dehydrogenase/reductase SDR [Penicillium pulvis]
MSYSDLKGKTFVITGAAAGQGRATALLLARQGANLGLLDLRFPQEVLDEVTRLGVEALGFQVDVSDSTTVEAAVKATAEKFNGIDGAANLAGWIGTQGWSGKAYALDTITDEDWDAMMHVNLTGIKNSLKAELRHIKDGGSIVNVASIAGQRGTPWNAPYGTAKWGVISLTKCAAQEAGTRNIRVNAVAPGVVDTALMAALGPVQQVNDRLITRTALKRVAQPEEVARTILFLLSNVSSYVTSSVINVDGGYQ